MVGFISAACFIYGIKYLPLSEAVTLMYTTPVFTGIILWALMNNPWSRMQWVLSLVSLLGVLMIARPNDVFYEDEGELNILGKPYTHDERVHGVILCIIQAILLSINLILIKAMGKRVHPLTLIIFILVACMLFSPIFMFYNGMT